MSPEVLEEEKYENVPVLKFIEDEAVVVFLKGGPIYALLMDNEKYEGGGPLYHIAAHPGTTATVKKKKVRETGSYSAQYKCVYEAYNVKMKEL